MPKYEHAHLRPLLRSDVKPAKEFANRSAWQSPGAGEAQEVETTHVTMTTFNQQQTRTQRR